jgi:hypothetical protein
VDLASLYQVDNMPLDFLDGPPERSAHALELDRREWLEV